MSNVRAAIVDLSKVLDDVEGHMKATVGNIHDAFSMVVVPSIEPQTKGLDQGMDDSPAVSELVTNLQELIARVHRLHDGLNSLDDFSARSNI